MKYYAITLYKAEQTSSNKLTLELDFEREARKAQVGYVFLLL